jgi:hypothetical protein
MVVMLGRQPVPDPAVADVRRFNYSFTHEPIEGAVNSRQADGAGPATQAQVHLLGRNMTPRRANGVEDRTPLPRVALTNQPLTARHRPPHS